MEPAAVPLRNALLAADFAQDPDFPLPSGPFVAVKAYPGSFAGLRTDGSAGVPDAGGVPIPGLHAAGRDMAGVMGGHDGRA